jgi:iron complex transport system ATP-binding protein
MAIDETAHGGTVAALTGVSVRRHAADQVILDDITWSIRSGEHWALLGPNGAGKSSILRLIGAVIHPTTGTVEVLGNQLGRVDIRELRAHIGLASSAQKVPQGATAHTVVLTGATGTIQPLWKAYDAATRKRAHELLVELGCKELADRPLGVCSGGQRARILIARALMPEPAILLLDEPFNALDLPSREDLIDALERLAASRPELATVTVTHHLEELPSSVGHTLLLKEGRLQAQGIATEVLTSEQLTNCFGRPIQVNRLDGRWFARSGQTF